MVRNRGSKLRGVGRVATIGAKCVVDIGKELETLVHLSLRAFVGALAMSINKIAQSVDDLYLMSIKERGAYA